MTAPDPRVGEVEARLAEVARLQNTRAEHAELDAAVYRSQSDVAYLLAELRKRDEALARVEAACDRVINNEDGHKPPGPPHPTQQQATALRIRAAVTGAKP